MPSAPKKVVVIGIDAPIVKAIEQYMAQGALPTFARLVKNGVWGENCLVPHPTITPPNWTTIVTGSWPGTHGITCFNVHQPGTRLDETYAGFLAKDCQSEYIWNAAARAGKRAIVINYPSTWPNCVKKGIQIGGAGLGVNEWRTDPSSPMPKFTVSADLLFTTEDLPQAQRIELGPADGWRNMPKCRNAIEAQLSIAARQARDPVEPQTWHLLALDTRGRGLDRVLVAKTKDAGKALFELTPGQWSGRIVEKFKVAGRNKKAVFMAKLLQLAKNGRSLKLYFSPICQLDGWAFPASVCRELGDVPGLPVPNAFYASHNLGWIDLDTLVEVIDLQHTWFAAAATHLMASREWDLYFMHAHSPDHCYHLFINKLDPKVCKDPKTVRAYLAAQRGFYVSLDRMIDTIVRAAGDDALVILTSDHGAVPTAGRFEPDFRPFNVGALLRQAGLTAFKKDKSTGKEVVDWKKTRAFAQRSVYVYVNLKGRDPNGIVKPGQDYDDVCDQVVELLTDYRDPTTGKKPIALALKKTDARIIGLYGDYVGDVVYGVRAEVSGEHGRQLPTGEFGMGDMHGLFVMTGPGVRRGLRLSRTVWLTDITPTICYLCNLPVPQDAEGAVLYQALQSPQAHLDELKRAQMNYQRLKSVEDAEKSLTHRYEEDTHQ